MGVFDALRASLGYEYSRGSWFWVPVSEARAARGVRPFGQGKTRPVVLATRLGPDAVLFPRSTKPSTKPSSFRHDAHRHAPDPPCRIDRPGWVPLHLRAVVDLQLLNEESYSCEEPEGSQLFGAMLEALRP